MNVIPSLRFSASIVCRISRPVRESRFAVGSSARMIAGLFTSARAIATRCCCPPDISLGRRFSIPSSPTPRNAAIDRSRASTLSTPSNVSGNDTFSSDDSTGIRLYA